MQIDFDPAQISYRRLLEMFWRSPTCDPSGGRQYRSVIYYANPFQQAEALASQRAQAARRGATALVEPAGHFYLAEDYHQKYYLRQTPSIMREFSAIYPNESDFLNSTAAARVNGILGGRCSRASAETFVRRLGLSAPAQAALLNAAP